jgi:hypothetical protein
MRRRHSDVLLAALTLIGAWFCIAMIMSRITSLDRIDLAGVGLAAAFLAVQIARRALPKLTLGDAVIAAPVAMALIIGVRAEYSGRPMELSMLLPIGVAAVGGVIGAYTSQRRAATVSAVWKVLLAGFVSLGAAALAETAIGLVAMRAHQIGYLAGAIIGSFIVAARTDTTHGQCAFGAASVLAITGAAMHPDGIVAGVIAGFIVGGFLGAIGGRIGDKFRPEPKTEAELPAAQVR